jgi:hypothetical protein
MNTERNTELGIMTDELYLNSAFSIHRSYLFFLSFGREGRIIYDENNITTKITEKYEE